MLKKLLIIFFIFITSLFSTVAAEEVLKINGVNFDNSDNLIFLSASTKVMYINVKSMKLSNPDRISFDIENAVLTKPNTSWTFKNSLIKQVKLAQFSTDPKVVRLVITYNKGFNVNKLKLHRIDNNLIFTYNKNYFTQNLFSDIYSEEKSTENYYEYTTFSEDAPQSVSTAATVTTPDSEPVRSPEAAEVQKAFNSNGELIKKDASTLNIKQERFSKLKSKFYVTQIDVKRGNALIRGIGEIAIESPFVVQNPTRLVFDMPNTYVAPTIRNKEYILSENETIKIGQNEPTKARIVVTSDDVNKYRPIYSYDKQSIFLAHDDRILGLKLFDRTSAIYTYSAKKINDTTDVLQFVFTQPIIHSIAKLDNRVELNLYNSSGFDHAAYQKALSSEVLAKLRTEALPEAGIKIIIPIKKNTIINYKESFDNKQLKLTLTTPKEVEITKPKPAVITKDPKVKTIVIDAGHGGSDVGATREGIYEKDITLDIAKRIETILKKKGNYNVLMVRSKDATVSLQERVDFAEDNGADLFISVHVNSSVTPEGNGIETHYYTPQSYDYAQIVHKEFASAIKSSKDRGLFKSKFYVINHTTCPSILVETGFISNPEERADLMTNERRQKTAEALAKGIQKFLGKD